MLNEHYNTYNTSVNTEAIESKSGLLLRSMNSGGAGETKALYLLREYGFYCIQQLDWLTVPEAKR